MSGAVSQKAFAIEESPVKTWTRLSAEFAGTFFLVFSGTGAIVIDNQTRAITHLGVALTFGLVVLALIYTIGETSGAHLNPAVTTGFALAGRFPIRLIGPYVLSQLGGAIAASAVLHALFPADLTLGSTAPAGTAVQSLVLEFLLTLFLMWVILNVSTGSKEKGFTAGIAVGAVVALEALFAGPICGASMNPARSIGPAIISGQLESLWIYVVAPMTGAAAAIVLNRVIRGPQKQF